MKVFKYVMAGALIFIVTISIAHAFVRPQQTRCMLIDVYDFQKDDHLYYRSGISQDRIDALKSIIGEAEKRVDIFWGGYTAIPKIIYCHSDDDYRKFGNPAMTPAVTMMNIGTYIVIHPSGMNVDVIAHEMSHAELFNRIGFLNRERKIPVWFDEGLAMQVDWRASYSMDSLKIQSNNFQSLPNVQTLNSYSEFGNGSGEEVHMNYATSKYVVGEWYTAHRLMKFIDDINYGSDFQSAYGSDY